MSKIEHTKQMIATALDKITIIGSIGTVSSVILKDISVVISILVGLATLFHVCLKIYPQLLKIKDSIKNKKRRSTDNE